MSITGAEYKKLNGDVLLYTLHSGERYRLYTIENIHSYITPQCLTVTRVRIPDDANVYDYGVLVVDKIQIIKMFKIDEFYTAFQRVKTLALLYRNDPSLDTTALRWLLELNGELLNVIENKTEELCDAAILNSPHVAKLCGFKFTFKSSVLAFVAFKDLQLIPEVFRTSELMLAAVRVDQQMFKYIPAELWNTELCEHIFTTPVTSYYKIPREWLTQELCSRAITQCYDHICVIPFDLQTPEMVLFAVGNDKRMLKFVNVTDEVYMFAYKKHGSVLPYVPSGMRTLKMQAHAVATNINMAIYI